jgi:sarcosine oxidase subunit beta
VRFHKEAVDLFKGLSDELDFNIMFSQRGQLILGHSEATLRSFRRRAEVNKLCGVRTEVIDLKQILDLVPFLNVEGLRLPVLGALWHPDGGIARHDAVAWGYARSAMREGVEIHQNVSATGLVLEGSRIRGVETTKGRIAATHVVQAVAGMSSEVARWAGIRLPIRTVPLQAMVTEPLKPFLDPVLSSAELHTYVSQTPRGELVMGADTDHYDLYSTRSSLEVKESMATHVLELLPFIGKVRVLRQWAGMTDVTPDASPIIGETEVQNYWLDAGCGTWGFKTTPVTGKYLAEAIATGVVPDIIKPFRLDRFNTFDLVAEMSSSAITH